MRMQGRRNGWTLVEVLIVIAILITLAGIVYAAYQPIRERSLRAVCASRMRQIWIHLENYRQDYGGIDPPAVDKPSLIGLPADYNQLRLFKASYDRIFPDGWTCPTGRPMEPFRYTSDFCNSHPCWRNGRVTLCTYPHCAFYMLWYFHEEFYRPDEHPGVVAAVACERLLYRSLGMQYPIIVDTCHREDLNSWINNFTMMVHLDGSFSAKVIPSMTTYTSNLCEQFRSGGEQR
jgi:type II secretory pathway pseudopilin PulG